jgi:hypothetical protein
LTIYQRTPDGQWAAYSADSPLPRRLKIFLKAIDGLVTEDIYAQNLVAFGDVRELLKSLEQSGLIEDVAAARNRPTVAHDPSIVSEFRQQIAQASELKQAREELMRQEYGDGQQFERTTTISPPAAPVLQVEKVPLDPVLAEKNLRLAIEAMSSFVISHLPDAAFSVLAEIEALQSLDQLTAMLDGYAQFVVSAGKDRLPHLAELHRLIKTAGGTNNAYGG